MATLRQHAKSKTQVFNAGMAVIDLLIVNAAMVQDLLTVKQFAATILILKVVQTLGNMYIRTKTTEALDAK